MTVSTTKNRIVFVGDSTTKIFSFDFKIIKAEHAKVYLVDNNIEDLQILGTDYSMTGLNNDTGGAIEMMIAPASGVKLVIVRELLPVQETSLRNQGRFYPEVHEDAFDYEMMLIQQVANSVGSSDGSSRLLALGVADTDGDGAYRAKGNRIINVGDPINENDVTRLKDIKPFADQAGAAQRAAENAQAVAEAAESAAEQAKLAAAESAKQAAESAIAADPTGVMQYHLNEENPHRQYILIKTTVPTVRGSDLIYVEPFGLMKWNTAENQYKQDDIYVLQNHFIGVPIPYPSAIPPIGYVVMQGQNFDPVVYPKLAQLYTTNTLPDLRGEFIRGWDNGRGIDVGRELLSSQLDALQNIKGSNGSFAALPNDGAFYYGKTYYGFKGDGYGQVNGVAHFDASRVARTADETRPRNISFNYICLTGEK